jgi:hypothetical protein
MAPPRSAAEQARRVQVHLRFIQHLEQVTRNVSQTCRFFVISRSQLYDWYARYREAGIADLQRCSG